MKTQVGLWIDHRETVIVTLIDDIEEIERIVSNVEEVVSDADAPHPTKQDRHSKRVDAQLGKYYEKLINMTQNASSLLIFGPGEAKYEFQKKLDHLGLRDPVITVETTDSMTEAQVVAKVRQHFVIS